MIFFKDANEKALHLGVICNKTFRKCGFPLKDIAYLREVLINCYIFAYYTFIN